MSKPTGAYPSLTLDTTGTAIEATPRFCRQSGQKLS